MIRFKFSSETITDLILMKHNLNVCVNGLEQLHPIVNVTLENDIVTFILDDGKTEMFDMVLKYENPLYEIANHISQYE